MVNKVFLVGLQKNPNFLEYGVSHFAVIRQSALLAPTSNDDPYVM